MKFAADAYARGICETAAGSEIEVLVDTIDGTVGCLGELLKKLGKNEEARDYTFNLMDRWSELRREIVEREHENEEGTTFASPPLDRDEVAAELAGMNTEDEWEHPDTGVIVQRFVNTQSGVTSDLWRVMDDGDYYNFYTLDDVLDELGV